MQGRLIKAWFGVSKFCSTTALREATGWKLASEVVVCHLRHGVRMGSFVEVTQSMPFGKDHVRRCMGMWLSNGLHHLWCETGQCYVASEESHSTARAKAKKTKVKANWDRYITLDKQLKTEL